MREEMMSGSLEGAAINRQEETPATREIAQRIHVVQDLTGYARRISNICENVGNNLLGVVPQGTGDSEKDTLDHNGSLQELDANLATLKGILKEGLDNAERIKNL